jgi:hypothetical protein
MVDEELTGAAVSHAGLSRGPAYTPPPVCRMDAAARGFLVLSEITLYDDAVSGSRHRFMTNSGDDHRANEC